jgi:hypothetical protein
MLYHPFPLKCFDKLKEQTLEYMNQFNHERIYVKNIPVTDALIQAFAQEMAEYGLSGAWNFLCFKRKWYLTEGKQVHIDFSVKLKESVHSSIILPLEGCDGTHMYWLNGDYELGPVEKANNVPYATLNWKTSPQLLDRVEISDVPMLAKVDIPHGVTSRMDGSYRTILSIRLLGNPTFEEVLQKRFDNKS